VGVFHDVLIMIAFYGLFRMTINNPFIAAILTVVGYSINDTIVIFDRIRENLGLMSRRPLDELIDTSINQTLVRSLMTSFTTLLAILPLVILGGDTIRQFAVPLMVGIVCGAASSIFVSSPIFYDLNRITGKGSKGGRYSAAVASSKSKADAINTGAGAKGKGKQSKKKRTASSGGAVV
jgi:SecD/SecF fusion protein